MWKNKVFFSCIFVKSMATIQKTGMCSHTRDKYLCQRKVAKNPKRKLMCPLFISIYLSQIEEKTVNYIHKNYIS